MFVTQSVSGATQDASGHLNIKNFAYKIVCIPKHGIPDLRVKKLLSMGKEYFKKIIEIKRRLDKKS